MGNSPKRITDYQKVNLLNSFYEFGITPDEVKQQVIETFTPLFKNKEYLENYSINYLVEPWLSYLTIDRDKPEYVKFIATILDILNDAKLKDPEKAIDNYVVYVPDFSQAISRFWSAFNSQTDIRKLCTEDYVEASLKIIGHTIEGMLKPFLKFLLQQNRLKRNKVSDFDLIQKLDLGDIISQLIDTSDLKDLFTIGKENIRLNQWRNIAYHHNSKVLNDEIFLWFKKQDDTFEFSISKEELYQDINDVVLIFKIIRIAEMIFCFDNLEAVQQKTEHLTHEVNTRKESEMLDFLTALSSQGFKIMDLKIEDKKALLKLQDMQDYGHFIKRAIHSSQFLYKLWQLTDSPGLEIEYYLSTVEKFFTSQINESEFIEYVESDVEDLDIAIVLKNVKFTYLNNSYSQNSDPFVNLQLSDEIRNSQQFYSQTSEKITAEEFSRLFILSVFSNYLAFISEGFNKHDITINISSDGALAVSKKPKSIAMHVPAVISSKELQTKLLELLNETIHAFEEKKLDHLIVNEARKNNAFYETKAYIKDFLTQA